MKRRTRCAVMAAVAASAIGVGGGGCLERPVVNRTPALDTVVNIVNPSQSIDKVDILFDIDNSASMGDKQAYLVQAIPDLVSRFVNPLCVDASGASHGPSAAGVCPQGSSPEFAPVHDLHLGIVSSSLGQRGGDICGPTTPAVPPFQNVLAHDDDRAHLLDRTLTFNGPSVSEWNRGGRLARPVSLLVPRRGQIRGRRRAPGNRSRTRGPWPPTSRPSWAARASSGAASNLQLESWYRFLVQPDPFDSIVVERGRRLVERRRHDDSPPAPRVPAPRFSRAGRRPQRRERLRDRRSCLERTGGRLDEQRDSRFREAHRRARTPRRRVASPARKATPPRPTRPAWRSSTTRPRTTGASTPTSATST